MPRPHRGSREPPRAAWRARLPGAPRKGSPRHRPPAGLRETGSSYPPIRQREPEPRPTRTITLGAHPPAMAANDLRRDRQPEARTCEAPGRRLALERLEHRIAQRGIEPHTIVAHSIGVLLLAHRARDHDAPRLPPAGE